MPDRFAYDLELARLVLAGEKWVDARVRGIATDPVTDAMRRFRREERRLRRSRKRAEVLGRRGI